MDHSQVYSHRANYLLVKSCCVQRQRHLYLIDDYIMFSFGLGLSCYSFDEKVSSSLLSHCFTSHLDPFDYWICWRIVHHHYHMCLCFPEIRFILEPWYLNWNWLRRRQICFWRRLCFSHRFCLLELIQRRRCASSVPGLQYSLAPLFATAMLYQSTWIAPLLC